MGGGTQTSAQRGGAFAPYKRFEPTAQNLGGGNRQAELTALLGRAASAA